MRRVLLLFIPFILLGTGCGDDYVTGASSNRAKSDFIIPGTVGVSAIVAPDFKNVSDKSGLNEFSFTLPQ